MADAALGAGSHTLGVEILQPDTGPPSVRLSADGRITAASQIQRLIGRFQVHASRSSVGVALDRTGSHSFAAPYAFSGRLHRLMIEPDPRASPRDHDHQADMREQ